VTPNKEEDINQQKNMAASYKTTGKIKDNAEPF
jgi:hypothetical protein